jgi:replicative DNA helicase
LEAEEAVLGAVLTAGRPLAEVAALLEEADFFRPAHRAIWRAMLGLADRDEPTDPVTVLGELDDSGELADVGGGPFLLPAALEPVVVAYEGDDLGVVDQPVDQGMRRSRSSSSSSLPARLAVPSLPTHWWAVANATR